MGKLPSDPQLLALCKIKNAHGRGFRGACWDELHRFHRRTQESLFQRGWVEVHHHQWDGGAYERLELTEAGTAALAAGQAVIANVLGITERLAEIDAADRARLTEIPQGDKT